MVGTIKVGKLQAADGTSNTISLESGHKLSASEGALSIPGTIVQVKEATTSGTIQSTSTSFVASGVVVSITPKFQNSKFVIQASGVSDYNTASGHNIQAKVYQKIGSGAYANAHSGSGLIFYQIYGDNFGVPHYGKLILTPNTTSELSYQIYYKSSNGNGVYINAYGGQHVIQVMEVAQ